GVEVVALSDGGIDRRLLDATELAVVHFIERRVEVGRDERVLRRELTGQLSFITFRIVGDVERLPGIADGGVGERAVRRRLGLTAGAEEPQTIANDAAADGGF